MSPGMGNEAGACSGWPGGWRGAGDAGRGDTGQRVAGLVGLAAKRRCRTAG
jgi:hypothetical protein